MPNDDERLNLIDSPKGCDAAGWGSLALTACRYCWKHLPEAKRTGFKEEIERLTAEHDWGLRRFILRGADLKRAVLLGPVRQH